MRVRLRSLSPATTRPRVDRTGNGKILGASIISKGPALGHGIDIDETTLDQVAGLTSGAKGRWTHGNLCADGLGSHLGRWSNVRRDGDQVVGDFEFSATAKSIRPAGLSVDAPTYLMDLAEGEADVAGVSIVVEGEAEELTVKGVRDGVETEETRSFLRAKKVPRADWVADPAANPAGMFADTPSALAEQATEALEHAAEFHGEGKVTEFLRAYLSAKGALPLPATDEAAQLRALAQSNEIMRLRAENEGLTATLAEVRALPEQVSLTVLQGELAGFKARDAARLKAEDTAFIASLATRSAELNAPIDAAKLAKVQAHLNAGRRDVAHELGEALLEAAGAKAGKPVTTDKPAAPPAANQHQLAAVQGEKRLLEQQGYTVTLSKDGTRIESAIPPVAAGKGK
ncbi:MAG TPA: hypothetical protein VEA38_16880 [Terriglobales bacterium]|nr:hypothetical protein [Terriglobales bacterium]